MQQETINNIVEYIERKLNNDVSNDIEQEFDFMFY